MRFRLSPLVAATAAVLLGALALLAATVPAPAAVARAAPGTVPGARAADGIGQVAAQLTRGPVYVDPRAAGELSRTQAEALAARIRSADKPVFVAVLPATGEFPAATVLRDLRAAVGVAGVYAIRLGGGFNAGADPQVMPHTAVVNLVGEVRRASGGEAAAELGAFVDQAVRQAHGRAPGTWSGVSRRGGGSLTGVLAGLLAVVVLAAGGVYLLRRRAGKARAARDRAGLEDVRAAVDEDITAFGEELDRLDFDPAAPGADDAMRADYGRALHTYERAKEAMAAARAPQDVRAVTEALAEGRFALATLDARRRGAPLPERRPPCFFDPRHGPSVADVDWAPPGGVPRPVPACAADATRVADGQDPVSRIVPTAYGPQPYWNAGPAYLPWAGGYYGGGLLPGVLVGTLLGGALAGPGYGYGYDGGGYDGGGDLPGGGDYTGSDFDPGDFGGGFGDGGGGFGDGGGDGGGFQ